MPRRRSRYALLYSAVAGIGGCGAVSELVVDTARESAKTEIEERVDETVDGLFDSFELPIPQNDASAE